MINLRKINSNYESDPNIADPEIKLDEDNITLFFALNYFIFKFKEGSVGSIFFKKVRCYRIGKPNDEGFFLNEHELWNKDNFPEGIVWNHFYEAENVPKEHFDSFRQVADFEKAEVLHHYVFFMKEATFECLAESFEEKFIN